MNLKSGNNEQLIQAALSVAAVFTSKYGAGSLGEIEDVKQTAILIALKLSKKGLSEKNLRPAIFFALIDEARRLGHYRTNVKTYLFDAFEFLIESDDDIQKTIDSRDHVSSIEKTLTLKELQIARLIQYGYKQTEIAKILNVNRATITRRIQRIRKKVLLKKISSKDNKNKS